MAFMQKLADRWDRRQSGLETVTVQERVFVSSRRDRVWAFLIAPESAMLTQDNVQRSFVVPGTPEGIGEQQCVIYEHQESVSAHIFEIVEITAPSLVVVRCLTVPAALLTRHELAPDGTGTTLTVTMGFRVEVGSRTKVLEEVSKDLRGELTRLKAAVESGVQLPTQDKNQSSRAAPSPYL